MKEEKQPVYFESFLLRQDEKISGIRIRYEIYK